MEHKVTKKMKLFSCDLRVENIQPVLQERETFTIMYYNVCLVGKTGSVYRELVTF